MKKAKIYEGKVMLNEKADRKQSVKDIMKSVKDQMPKMLDYMESLLKEDKQEAILGFAIHVEPVLDETKVKGMKMALKEGKLKAIMEGKRPIRDILLDK